MTARIWIAMLGADVVGIGRSASAAREDALALLCDLGDTRAPHEIPLTLMSWASEPEMVTDGTIGVDDATES